MSSSGVNDTGEASSSSSGEKDVLLIVASVSMALATIALILIVRLLERCLPDAEREESARALEKKAVKMRELIDSHTQLLTYSQWLSKMREKYGLPSLSRSGSRQASRTDLESVAIAKSSVTGPQPGTGTGTGGVVSSQPWSEDCAVCLTEFTVDERIREIAVCTHIFHEECLHGWFVKSKKPVCPLCRFNLQSARIEEEEADNALTTTDPENPTTDRPSSSSNQHPSTQDRNPGIPVQFLTEFV